MNTGTTNSTDARTATYWVCTALIAFIFISSGVFYLLRVPQVVEGVTRLGFPLHFVTLLGLWKVFGGIAILMPGLARAKEWAYAGMYFDLTGAIAASVATGNAWWHIAAPLAVTMILSASWALRPPNRIIGVLFRPTRRHHIQRGRRAHQPHAASQV